jgi:hypothetical protein
MPTELWAEVRSRENSPFSRISLGILLDLSTLPGAVHWSQQSFRRVPCQQPVKQSGCLWLPLWGPILSPLGIPTPSSLPAVHRVPFCPHLQPLPTEAGISLLPEVTPGASPYSRLRPKAGEGQGLEPKRRRA